MDPEKVKAISEWLPPKNVQELQVFLGFVNFYRRFIKDYSKICSPLTALLKKNAVYNWTAETATTFNDLKQRITSNPILKHYNPDAPCTIETDASDYALGAVCSQPDSAGILHPIAFHSRKLLPAEMNYQIYDKELLAVVDAFKHWRHYLEFSAEPTTVITDHKNLEYFNTTRNLTRRQVRWSEILSDYNFQIIYRPGKQNAAADALSRKDRPLERGGDYRKGTTSMTLLPPKLFVNSIQTAVNLNQASDSLVQDITKSLEKDPTFGPILKDIKNNERKLDTDNYHYQDGLLFYKNKAICIPDNEEIKKTILEQCHDSPAAGHFGITKTYDQVSREYYWPGLRVYVKRYVTGCDTCLRNKNAHHKPYGLLQPLPIPEKPWVSISMDFITQLPPSEGFTAICVIVDRFTKMAIFLPTHNSIDAEGTCDLLLRHVFCHFGFPADIVSDRGVTFTSKFTAALMKAFNIKQNMSTAFHPQTDGQTERVNSILEQYLRCYINYQQSDWCKHLSIAQFAYNSSTHSSTGMTPHFANYGYEPHFSLNLPHTTKGNSPALDRAKLLKELHEEVKYNIALAQENHIKYHDINVLPGPSFKIGDKVWLLSRNVKTQRPTAKLDHKRLGPYKILEKIGSRSYKLELPHTMQIHPVFHVNLLEPFKEDTIPGRTPKELPPVVVNNHDEYEVEYIVDSRVHRRKLQYLVHWKNYSIMDRTWEPASHLKNSRALIDKFHKEHPNKPKTELSRSSS